RTHGGSVADRVLLAAAGNPQPRSTRPHPIGPRQDHQCSQKAARLWPLSRPAQKRRAPLTTHPAPGGALHPWSWMLGVAGITLGLLPPQANKMSNIERDQVTTALALVVLVPVQLKRDRCPAAATLSGGGCNAHKRRRQCAARAEGCS